MKFTISILAHNQLAATKRCVESVLASKGKFDLFLTDNGSTDGTGDYFCQLADVYKNIVHFSHSKNLGFILANHGAFAACHSHYFAVLNNDCQVPPNWLTAMEAEFKNNPTAAIVGVKGNPCSIGQNIGGFVGPDLEYIEFSCAMLRTDIFIGLSLFPPQLVGAYCEDIDCSLRVRELGYTIHQADIAIQHERSTTSRHVPEVRGWIENNVRYIRQRWAHYLKVRRFDYPQVVRSGNSVGHPLLTVPVLKGLKAARPLSPIYIETEMPELFTGIPEVTLASRNIPPMKDELRINLDSLPTLTTSTGLALRPGSRIKRGDKPPDVVLLYVYVPGQNQQAATFVSSYLEHPPEYEHRTLIVCNGWPPDNHTRSILSRLPGVTFVHHNNSGWDIGAYIYGASYFSADIVICFGSHTYVKRKGWMKRMVEAWTKHGPGLYGAFASYEVRPHLNTTAIWCAPDLLRRYPFPVNSKSDRYDFEHGPRNFWELVAADGYPVKLVTWDGEYDSQDWRKPDNIYRRGDQSNCLARFRITDDYDGMDAPWKKVVEGFADTLTV